MKYYLWPDGDYCELEDGPYADKSDDYVIVDCAPERVAKLDAVVRAAKDAVVDPDVGCHIIALENLNLALAALEPK